MKGTKLPLLAKRCAAIRGYARRPIDPQGKEIAWHRSTRAWNALKLTTNTASAPRTVHLHRILPPDRIAEFIKEFDAMIRALVETIMGVLPGTITDAAWARMRLPEHAGGIGCRTGTGIAACMFVSATIANAAAAALMRPEDQGVPLRVARARESRPASPPMGGGPHGVGRLAAPALFPFARDAAGTGCRRGLGTALQRYSQQ